MAHTIAANSGNGNPHRDDPRNLLVKVELMPVDQKRQLDWSNHGMVNNTAQVCQRDMDRAWSVYAT